jgi:hypothetical protein
MEAQMDAEVRDVISCTMNFQMPPYKTNFMCPVRCCMPNIREVNSAPV